MNRHHRRALFRAMRGLERCTKVPGRVQNFLNPKALSDMAAKMGRKLHRDGRVTPVVIAS